MFDRADKYLTAIVRRRWGLGGQRACVTATALAAFLAIPACAVAHATAVTSAAGAAAPATAAGAPASMAGPAAAKAGSLRAWGANGFGQLGDGTTGIDSDTPVSVRLPGHTRITAARAGCDHSLALTGKGRVLAWGRDSAGQLGDGKTTSTDKPVYVRLPRHTTITAVRAGCNYSLALTSKGRVLAWGAGSAGQLGDGNTTGSDTPVKVRLPRSVRVKIAGAGLFHSLALSTRGQLYAWGYNGAGQLGTGSISFSDLPVRVQLAAGLTAIAIGSGPLAEHSLAIVRPR
jgi:alpha-tubulin suppressor-like RCC1 family protein